MPPTILVLDQNSTVQRMMKLTFKEESVRVNTVKAGEDPFASIDAQPPDIIFTENAGKVVAFLKSRPTLPRIAVVQLKGAFDSPGANADEETADAVLTKPLQPDAMIACVRRLLQARDAAPASREAPPPAGDDRSAEGLDLEQYFDQLEVAFNEADGSSSRLDGEIWDAVSAPAVDGARKRPLSPTDPDRPRVDRPASPELGVTNELVDHIAQRVMDRLGERIVRSAATEVVSRLSKWLLVTEIEKGKSAL